MATITRETENFTQETVSHVAPRKPRLFTIGEDHDYKQGVADNVGLAPHSGSIAEIAAIPSRTHVLEWSTDTAVDAMLARLPVTVGFLEPNAVTEHICNADYLGHAARLWEGDVVFTVDVVSTAWHQGILMAAFSPSITALTYDQANGMDPVFLNIHKSKKMELKVPYQYSRAVRETGEIIGYFHLFCAGKLNATSTSVSTTIDINLWKHVENLKLKVPMFSQKIIDSEARWPFPTTTGQMKLRQPFAKPETKEERVVPTEQQIVDNSEGVTADNKTNGDALKTTIHSTDQGPNSDTTNTRNLDTVYDMMRRAFRVTDESDADYTSNHHNNPNDYLHYIQNLFFGISGSIETTFVPTGFRAGSQYVTSLRVFGNPAEPSVGIHTAYDNPEFLPSHTAGYMTGPFTVVVPRQFSNPMTLQNQFHAYPSPKLLTTGQRAEVYNSIHDDFRVYMLRPLLSEWYPKPEPSGRITPKTVSTEPQTTHDESQDTSAQRDPQHASAGVKTFAEGFTNPRKLEKAVRNKAIKFTEVMETPYLVQTVEFNTSTAENQLLINKPLTELVDIEDYPTRGAFTYQAYHRYSVEASIKLTATTFHAGKLMMVYNPLGNDFGASKQITMNTIKNCLHTEIPVGGDTTDACLEVPFFSENFTNPVGNIQVYMYNQLKATAEAGPVTITLFFRYKNMEISTRVPSGQSPIEPTPFTKVVETLPQVGGARSGGVDISSEHKGTNYIGQLKEWRDKHPDYHYIMEFKSTGPSHAPLWTCHISMFLEDKVKYRTEGEGVTKTAAQQTASLMMMRWCEQQKDFRVVTSAVRELPVCDTVVLTTYFAQCGDVESNPGPAQSKAMLNGASDDTTVESFVRELGSFLKKLTAGLKDGIGSVISYLAGTAMDFFNSVKDKIINWGFDQIKSAALAKFRPYWEGFVKIFRVILLSTSLAHKLYCVIRGDITVMVAMIDIGLMCTADWVVSLAREIFSIVSDNMTEQQAADDSDWYIPLLTAVTTLALGSIGYSQYSSRSFMSMLAMTLVRPAITDAYKVIKTGVMKIVEWTTGKFSKDESIVQARNTLASYRTRIATDMTRFYELKNSGYFTSFITRKQDQATVDNIAFLTRTKHFAGRLRTLISLTKTDMNLWTFIKDVEETWTTVLHSQLGSIGRMEPVGILIKGPTGCGKSHFASSVIPEIVLMRLKFIIERGDARSEIYNMPTDPDQKFYDGYTGQSFAIFDDFGTQTDGKDYNAFLPLISSASQSLNMASLSEKGTMFCSPFVCLTTNQDRVQSAAIRNPEAFSRKFKNAYSFGINTDRNANIRTLDFAGLTQEVSRCTKISEELAVYDRHITITKYNPHTGNPVGGRISFADMIEDICTSYTVKRAALISNRDKRFNLQFDLNTFNTDTDNLICTTAVAAKMDARNVDTVPQTRHSDTEYTDCDSDDEDTVDVDTCTFCDLTLDVCTCLSPTGPPVETPVVPDNDLTWLKAYMREGGFDVAQEPKLAALTKRLQTFKNVKIPSDEDGQQISFMADFIKHLANDHDVIKIGNFATRFGYFEKATLDLWQGDLVQLCLYVRTQVPDFIGKTLRTISESPALTFLDVLKAEPDLTLQQASAFVLAYCYFNISFYNADVERKKATNRPVRSLGIPEGNDFRFIGIRVEAMDADGDDKLLSRLRVFMATWTYKVNSYPLECIFKQAKDFVSMKQTWWSTCESANIWLIVYWLCLLGFAKILHAFWSMFTSCIWSTYFPEQQTKYNTDARRFGKRVYNPTAKVTSTVQQYKDPDPDFNSNVGFIAFGNGDFSTVHKPAGTVLFIDDQHIITNRHGLAYAEKNGGFYVMRDQFVSDAMEAYHFKDCVYKTIEPVVRTVGAGESDLVLVRLPQRFAGVRNFKRRFLRSADLLREFGGWMKPVTFLGKYSINCDQNYQAIMQTEVTAQFKDLKYTVMELSVNGYQTQKGDCGVPYVSSGGDIVAIHVGRNHLEDTAHAILLSREVVQDALDALTARCGEKIHVDFILPQTDPQHRHSEWHSDDAGYENLGVLREASGKVYTHYTPYKSEYVPSNIQDQAKWPDKHAPSLLSREILLEQSQKYGFTHAANAPTVEENNFVLEDWRNILNKRPNRSTRILSDNEILNGTDDMAPMMRDTSAGSWSAISQQKKDLIDVEYLEESGEKWQNWSEDFYSKKHPYYQRSCADVIREREEEGAAAERHTPSIWLTTLKSELVKEKKIIEKKTRVFEASSLDNTVLVKKYFGAFAEWFRANHGIVLGHAIGTDKETDWGAIYKMLHRRGFTKGIDLDYAKFDSTVPPAFFTFFLEAVEMYYHDSTQEERNIRAALMHDMQFAFQLIDGNLCLSKKGNKSGGNLTDIENSLCNKWALMICFHRIHKNAFGIPPTLSEWMDNVSLLTYGDDVCMSASDATLSWFHGANIGEVLHDLGFRATAGDKTELKAEPQPIKDLGFLKSGFKEQGDIVLAPMPAEIAWRELNWVRRKHLDNHTVHIMMWNDALKFMAWRSKEEYDLLRKQIEEVVRTCGLYDVNILWGIVSYQTIIEGIWFKQQALLNEALYGEECPVIYRNYHNF